jgi:three-Cys-motif partner protein
VPDHDEKLWNREAPTAAKHQILRGYLDAWLPIMGSTHDKLVLVDGFAGPGEYKDGALGSPMIMLQAFLEHAYRDRITAELVFLFIEVREDRVRHLQGLVDALDLPSNVTVSVQQGHFEDVFGGLVEDIEKRGSALAPTFTFVDPFGYKDATMSLSDRFLRFYGCEALIYVPLPFIYRFVGAPNAPADALDGFFGSERWRDAAELAGDARWNFLHNLFRDQLQSAGRVQHVRSFEIRGKGFSGYHLFFGSSHELGLRKMKEAMWSVDPTAGERYLDSTDPAQEVLFATTQVDTAPLLARLRDHFGMEPFSIEQAEHFTLLHTPYLPSHVKTRTLKPEEAADRLAFVSGKPDRRRCTYPPGTVVRFS